MNPADLLRGFDTRAGLLIDTNLLVLFVVGSVNPDRISDFKRTSNYSLSDYRLLRLIIERISPIYTVPHVMAEVSNLTDMNGPERLQARLVLKATMETLEEPAMPSLVASRDENYTGLGLVDAAIAVVARERKCGVLTDDHKLYLALCRQGATVVNFTHLRAAHWGV